MAIVKGEKAKSLRKRRWVLQIDQTLDTPIKMSSENSPKAVEKLVLQPQNKSKRSSQCFAPPHFACSSSSSSSSSSRVQIPSGVLRPLPRGASRGSRTVHFLLFPTKKQLCVSVRRSRVQIPVQVRKLWFHLPFWMTISEDDSHMESFRIEEFFFWGQCLFVAKCL